MKHSKIIYSLLFILSVWALGGCSEKALDDVNFDKNHPQDVAAKFILTDVLTSTAFSTVGGDISLYTSIYLEQEAGVHGQAYNAEVRNGEPILSTTNNNSWDGIYANIKGLKIAIAKTSNGGVEAGNDVTCGIAKVMLAYNLGVLTDMFGDVPFSESGEMNPNGTPKFMQPKIDKQSELYPKIQSLLDEAIVLLAGTDKAPTGSMGKQDLIYGGNAKSWIKAANGLKARYLLHTLKVSADKAGDYTKILDYISKSFVDASEEMKFSAYDGSAAINPLYGIVSARLFLGVSHSFAKKLTDLNDPRGASVFMKYSKSPNFDFFQIPLETALKEAPPSGNPIESQQVYPLSLVDFAPTAPTQLLSFHELQFIKAEVLARQGKLGNAATALQTAIVAAFANLETALSSTTENMGFEKDPVIDVSENVANDYYTSQVAARFTINPLKEIMLQKYIGFYGAAGEATEAFNDFRRLKSLGEDFITLENPLNAQGKFPLRLPYGNSDVSANTAIKTAYGNGAYVYTEPVWWAGGTR